jgi:ectoine hydroxylase-related dioxygenase (phytanoyl-CoA dioxygenase family)
MVSPQTDAPATPAGFATRGYCVVPDVLGADQVARLRAYCDERLHNAGVVEMAASEILPVRALAEIPFLPAVVDALRPFLGADFRVYPNMTVRKDLYVPWHVDDAFGGPRKEYVWEPDFVHIQAAVYLQDNSGQAGGGIDAVPGSHLTSFDEGGTAMPHYRARIDPILQETPPVTVTSRAGDLVMWHARLLHASTAPTTPRSLRKYGFFFSAGRNHAYENNRFLSHLVSKGVRLIDGRPVHQRRFAEVVDLRYPASFPDWLVSAARARGIGVATF